jgi:predicted phage terminase large subunit-like protein
VIPRLLPYAVGQWSGYQPAKHHWALADRLEKVAEGEIKRLMIFMPPRHGKSMLTSEFFPAWYLGRHPDHQVIAATYAQGLADDFGRKVRNLVSNRQHEFMFPGFRLADDSQAASRFHTKERGAYFAVGAGGPITGRGADLLLIDDPIKGREDAESEVMRRHLKDWYTSVARTRLMPGGAIVVIQTRWHEDDLAGWLLKEHAHEEWEVLNLPAIAEPDDQIGRQEGVPLWPQAYPLDELDQIRRSVGSRDWASLYQQRPTAEEGAIFKREHWQYSRLWLDDPQALIDSLGIFKVIQAWDTAFKTKEMNDYSACVTIGVARTKYFVLDVKRGRFEFPELKRVVQTHAAKWNASSLLIEDTSAGQSIIQELRRETRLPLIAVKADRDKVARSRAITATHEAGMICLPEAMPWLPDFMDEVSAFPNAPHDDQLDAFVHAMRHAITTPKPEKQEEDDFESRMARQGRMTENSWMG